MISIRASAAYDPPRIYIDEKTNSLKGFLGKTWNRYSRVVYHEFNVTWTGQEANYGNCQKTVCSRLKGLVQQGSIDTYLQSGSLTNYPDIAENVSLSAPNREEVCWFQSQFVGPLPVYAGDTFDSLNIYFADVWTFLGMAYLTCSVLAVIGRCYVDIFSRRVIPWRKSFGTWIDMLMNSTSPKSDQTVIFNLAAIVLTMIVLQIMLIYLAAFHTDTTISIPERPVKGFDDLIEQNMVTGVYKYSNCHTLAGSQVNLQKYLRVYLDTGYCRQALGSKPKQIVILGEGVAVSVYKVYACSQEFVMNQTPSRYYLEETNLPKLLMVNIYNSWINIKIREALHIRFYALAEFGLMKKFTKLWLVDASSMMRSPPAVCFEEHQKVDQFTFNQLGAVNYKKIGIIFASFSLISVIFLFGEIRVFLSRTN